MQPGNLGILKSMPCRSGLPTRYSDCIVDILRLSLYHSAQNLLQYILLCSPKWFDGYVHFNKKSRFLRCSLGLGLNSKGRYDIKMQRYDWTMVFPKKKSIPHGVSKNFMVNSSSSFNNSGFFQGVYNPPFFHEKKPPPKSQISGEGAFRRDALTQRGSSQVMIIMAQTVRNSWLSSKVFRSERYLGGYRTEKGEEVR